MSPQVSQKLGSKKIFSLAPLANFYPHFQNRCAALVLRAKVPSRILLNIYYAFVHPHLLYATEVYGIDKLFKLNNKLLRILQHKPFRSHVPDLYLEFNTLPFFMNSNY